MQKSSLELFIKKLGSHFGSLGGDDCKRAEQDKVYAGILELIELIHQLPDSCYSDLLFSTLERMEERSKDQSMCLLEVLKKLNKRFLHTVDRWDLQLEAQKAQDSEVLSDIAAVFKAQCSTAEGNYKPLLGRAVNMPVNIDSLLNVVLSRQGGGMGSGRGT